MYWMVLVVAWVALSAGFVLGCRWVAVCRRWDMDTPILPPEWQRATARRSRLRTVSGP